VNEWDKHCISFKKEQYFEIPPLTPPSPSLGERGRMRVRGKGGFRREILYLEDFRGFILETIP
jgi:hypothetical protein